MSRVGEYRRQGCGAGTSLTLGQAYFDIIQQCFQFLLVISLLQLLRHGLNHLESKFATATIPELFSKKDGKRALDLHFMPVWSQEVCAVSSIEGWCRVIGEAFHDDNVNALTNR